MKEVFSDHVVSRGGAGKNLATKRLWKEVIKVLVTTWLGKGVVKK
jgi:hypothetical protein